MNLLELVIIAHRCRSTHHFLAIDALSLLKGKHSDRWYNLALRYHESLLKGAKAPDTTFKDFKNHVLHVQDGEWGGARDAAMEWYGKAVEALRREKWSDAMYALGVMTHYYADPIQPFHTAQSEEEGAIHRAMEWSIAKSRDKIKAMVDARGYPTVASGREIGFVADMVLAGAKYSNPHYQTFIDHYDIDRGVKDPPAGLDETLLDILADLVAYATSGIATLFDRAFEEAAVKPPKIDLDLPGYLAALDIPIRKLTKRIGDARDRKQVEAMYEELQETGKVIKTLPADDKKIRKLHAEQVLRTSIHVVDTVKLKPLGTKHKPIKKPVNPVEYVLKLVPIPFGQPKYTAGPALAEPAAPAPRPKPIAPDPEVFDVPETVEALTPEPEVAAAREPEPVIEAKDDPAPQPLIEAAEEVIEAPVAEIVEEVAQEAEPEELQDEAASEPAPTPAAKVLAELEAEETSKAAPEADSKPEKSAAKAEKETKDDKPAKTPKAERTDRLTELSPVVDAPSIGPKTAARLETVGISTIGDLLAADAEETAAALNVRYITTLTLCDWQDQTRLMLHAPGLRVLDSQILVGAGIRDAKDLANASARSVLEAAKSFLETPGGSRVLWGAESTVDEGEVRQWIDLAKTAGN